MIRERMMNAIFHHLSFLSIPYSVSSVSPWQIFFLESALRTRWLKLTVAYDGTAYSGWQFQPDKPTIQGAIEATWQRLTQETLRVTAAGRTDAGVHALGQVVGLATETRLTNEDLHRGLNALLPDDIAVIAIEDAR